MFDYSGDGRVDSVPGDDDDYANIVTTRKVAILVYVVACALPIAARYERAQSRTSVQ